MHRHSRLAHLRRRARPEDRLLLWCARARVNAEAAAEIQTLLRDDLDWDHVLHMADANEVTPLVHRTMKAHRSFGVPATPADHLERSFYDNVGRNVRLTTELLDVLDRFAAQGIEAVPFKGPALAVAAYGDISLRQFTDLDILVRKQDLGAAETLLADLGYRRHLDLTGLRGTAYHHSETAYDFVSADGRVTVELHWELLPRYLSFVLDLEPLTERLDSVALLGATVPSLDAEDLLLYLCVHGTKHRWERLKWVCDVAELIQAQPALDWSAVVERATRLRSERMIALGLALASDLLDAPLPDNVRAFVRSDPSAARLAADAFARLFAVAPTPAAQDNLYYLRAFQSPWRRLRYVMHVLTVPTRDDLESLALPGPLALLYYPLRPLRVLGQALRLCRRRPAAGAGPFPHLHVGAPRA